MKQQEYARQFAVEATHWWFVARRRFVERVLDIVEIAKGSRLRIADIGAGTGGMERFLSAYGTVIGIEPSPTGRILAKKRGIRLQAGTAEQTDLESASVDLVCFFDVLYHKQVDVTRALNEAHRILKPNGTLVITDCAVPWLYGPNDRAVEGRERFTKQYLMDLVTSGHLQVRYCSYIYFLLFPVFMVGRLTQKYILPKREVSDVAPLPTWVNTVFSAICRVEERFLPFGSLPWGSSLILIAQK
ncbi:MAG TPA: class I SAM-dependent methyltransferase [Chloroflexota bacterium]